MIALSGKTESRSKRMTIKESKVTMKEWISLPFTTLTSPNGSTPQNIKFNLLKSVPKALREEIRLIYDIEITR